MATIEDLEGDSWGDPDDGATPLVRRCLALRRKDLLDFEVEDLRVLLGQRIAVPILLPRAIEVLLIGPLAEGDHYPGDLLHAVVRLPPEVWNDRGAQRGQLAAAAAPFLDSDEVPTSVRPAIQDFVAATRH